MLLAARLVLVAWLAPFLLVIQIGISLLFTPAELWLLHRNVFAVLFTVFVAFSIGYLATALGIKCATCGRRLLIERSGPKHPNSRQVWFMDRWATAIIDVVRFGHCTCMYCGSKMRVRVC